MNLWNELKRRKVFRVAIAYVVVGWGLIQVADATLEPLRLPEWSDTFVIWLVALGFPVAVILAWVVDVTPRGLEVTSASDSREKAEPDDASIAVLPFVNMSGDPENEYFSDGLSEELLNLLVRLRSVRVCSRTSSFSIKGKDFDLPTVADTLGVRNILEGSVRRSGSRVRINVQLVDAVSDRPLWSETYDREVQDIFEVQQEIASRIFESLRIELTDSEQQAARATTESFDALDFYLRGRELYHRTEPGHLERSRQMFEQALGIDPDYAHAWAGLTYVFVDTYWYTKQDPELLRKADETSRKAVDLAPHLAEPHSARGLALRAAEKFEEAEAEFKKAIKINPQLFEPIHFYAQMARSMKNYELAAQLFEQAGAVRPEDYQALALAANMYEALENEETAKALSRTSLERAERALALNPKDSRAWILGASCLLRVGERTQVMEWVEKAREASPESNGVAYNSACIYARLGEDDRALDLIERAIELGSRNRRYYETDPDFERLQENPRFRRLLESI